MGVGRLSLGEKGPWRPVETASLGMWEMAQEAGLLWSPGMYLGSGRWSVSSRILFSFWLSLQHSFTRSKGNTSL